MYITKLVQIESFGYAQDRLCAAPWRCRTVGPNPQGLSTQDYPARDGCEVGKPGAAGYAGAVMRPSAIQCHYLIAEGEDMIKTLHKTKVLNRYGSDKLSLVFLLCCLTLVAVLGVLLLIEPRKTSASSLDGISPTLTAVSPTEAYNWQPTTVTITGTGFFVISGTNSIFPTAYLGNIPLTDVTFVSSTTLTATVPADLPGGTYTLTVTNPDAQVANLTDAFTILHRGDGALASWQVISSMTTPRSGFAAVTAGGYVYVLGGYGLSSVERAVINPDGSLGPWQTMTSMTTPRRALAAVVANGYIYALGGDGGFQTVERAAINPDGSLGPWQLMTSMTIGRYYLAAVQYNDYIYLLGGIERTGGGDQGALDSVERAAINPDGSLGPWQAMSSMNVPRQMLATVAVNGYIYALGGFNGNSGVLDSVERVTINADGTLGPWQTLGPMTTNREVLAAAVAGGYIYALGGVQKLEPGSDLSSVERAALHADGSLGPWQTATSMTMPRVEHAAVTMGGYFYTLGGWNGFSVQSSVERARINPPSLISASPAAIPASRLTAITIMGTNFLPKPTVRFGEAATLTVSFVSTRTLTTTVPAGLTSGWYTATLVNPDGQTASLVNAIRVDDTIPTAGGLSINGEASSSTSIDVTLTVSATDPTDGVSGMSFSNDSNTWSDWQSYSVYASWQLSDGDGLKMVYGRFQDTAGNVSSVVSDAIELDTTVGTDYGLTINEGALYTNQTTVTLKNSAEPRTAQMQISNDGGFAETVWEPYASRKIWRITRYGDYVIPRVVYVRYKDISGNISATYQDDIILDVTAPTGSVQAVPGVPVNDLRTVGTTVAAMYPISLSTTDDYSYAVYLPLVLNNFCTPPTGPANVTLHLQAEDDVSGVVDMIISHLPSFNCARWEPYTTTRAWYAPDGTTMVYVKFRDNAGNVSETVTDTIAWSW
jgi:hypothetical protein